MLGRLDIIEILTADKIVPNDTYRSPTLTYNIGHRLREEQMSYAIALVMPSHYKGNNTETT